MIDGDLLEVTLDENHNLWKVLQAMRCPPHEKMQTLLQIEKLESKLAKLRGRDCAEKRRKRKLDRSDSLPLAEEEDEEGLEPGEVKRPKEEGVRGKGEAELPAHDVEVSRSSVTHNGVEARRKAITLEMKLKIIAQREGGKLVKTIAREFGLSHSTISTIFKDKKRISDAVKSSASVRSTIISMKRAGPLDDMERLLVAWMEDQIQKGLPLRPLSIQDKARSLFHTLKQRAHGPTYTHVFTATPGWFKRFKRRHNFHHVRFNGQAAGADNRSAAAFKEELHGIIADEKYLPEQIFNVDETGLFWKRMPERTYIHQESRTTAGFKACTDCVTLLLGGNVSGFKLKPLLIYHSENPRALKNVSKHLLPVYYRHNRKAWMTSVMFEGWFVNCFVPQAREYCRQNHVPFKLLLVLDNGPGHPPHIGDLHPNVKVVYLPPYTTALIQPMGQGVIAAFKAYYVGQMFAQAVEVTQSGQTLREFWREFNIASAIRNIAAAWEEVTQQCMKGAWKQVLPTHAHTAADSAVDGIVRGKILVLGRRLELDIDEDDVRRLVGLEAEELSNEELIRLEEDRGEEAETEEEDVAPQAPKTFAAEKLAAAFAAISDGVEMLADMDSNDQRVANTDRQIQEALACYREIYNDKKKQLDVVLNNTVH
ncbi:tigger transposable element-derived protein 1-like isoform X2 [Amblyraja radiata]|nr:tigger transposable element-derived protein 1-like isoform X2 [Amblyraja radiata]